MLYTYVTLTKNKHLLPNGDFISNMRITFSSNCICRYCYIGICLAVLIKTAIKNHNNKIKTLTFSNQD